MTRAAIGLGSNVGDRRQHLEDALRQLESLGRRVGVSGIYETAPIGGPEQGSFLNAVAVIDTERTPPELMAALLEIENRHGRLRRERWGPRTLDLDLLLFGSLAVKEPALTVPHPRLTERRFVLEPLVEAWPDAALPDGTPVATLLAAVSDQDVVRLQGARATSIGPAVFVVTALLALGIWWLLDVVLG